MNLIDLKKQYDSASKKYKLPSFEELNSNFEIDKIDKETDNLLKNIRKVMMDKVVNSLQFLDMLSNPVNAPRVYQQYLRSMSLEDKKEIDKIYDVLGILSLGSLDLEIDPSEIKEAELIKKILISWNSVKPSFRRILDNMKHPSVNGNSKKEKSYFG